MINSDVNDMDPVADAAFPQIEPMDPALPEPPYQDDLPVDAEQTEPENVEVP